MITYEENLFSSFISTTTSELLGGLHILIWKTTNSVYADKKYWKYIAEKWDFNIIHSLINIIHSLNIFSCHNYWSTIIYFINLHHFFTHSFLFGHSNRHFSPLSFLLIFINDLSLPYASLGFRTTPSPLLLSSLARYTKKWC